MGFKVYVNVYACTDMMILVVRWINTCSCLVKSTATDRLYFKTGHFPVIWGQRTQSLNAGLSRPKRDIWSRYVYYILYIIPHVYTAISLRVFTILSNAFDYNLFYLHNIYYTCSSVGAENTILPLSSPFSVYDHNQRV